MRPLPADLATTRDALHQLAFFALAPARYRAQRRMGLHPTPDGFATPTFDGKTASVEGDLLVLETALGVATQTVTTVREACRFLGIPYDTDWFVGFRDPLHPVPPDRRLDVDPDVTRHIAEWFMFGVVVLERLRAMATPDDDVGEVQLWPEHFDLATEIGRGPARGSYGFSPGDRSHPEPYVYLAAWGVIDRGLAFWNDRHFNGASLGYGDLVASSQPADDALEFLLEGYRILNRA
ncbi:MAG: hypothetical protein L0Z63_10385 [Actinobacteria bacterium]|nr:hypothetical protein [Actinomycetota bacterium]